MTCFPVRPVKEMPEDSLLKLPQKLPLIEERTEYCPSREGHAGELHTGTFLLSSG